MDQMSLYTTFEYQGFGTHHTYHYPGVTDLDVLRTQARRRQTDKRCPENTVIHFHEHGKNSSCTDKNHEEYLAGLEE